MKVALLAIVKNENRYLPEWCQWYKDIGIDKIYLYDNNDLDGERPEDVLSEFGDLVMIIDWRGKNIKTCHAEGKTTQGLAYRHWWNNYHELYDWVCIFDADEFLHISEVYGNLDTFLNDFDKYCDVKIPWVVYGDNEQIFYKEGGVRERFNSPSNAYKSYEHKSIVNCKKNTCSFFGAHGPIAHKKAVNVNKQRVKQTYRDYKIIDNPAVWLEHYLTKSTEEYFIRHWHRTNATLSDKLHWDIKYMKERYYRYNTPTAEKEQFIANFTK